MGNRPLPGRFLMKTYAPKPGDIERRWYVVDAGGAVLGRLATHVASVLRGKHKPIYAPHADTGDYVIVINAAGVRLTGGKENKKVAYHHSGYPGGLRETGYARLLIEKPVFVIEKAVRGMLPHNRLGRSMARKLSVYEGPEHPHEAQKPVPLGLGEVPKWEGLPAPKPRVRPAELSETPEKPEKPVRRRAQTGATGEKRVTAKRTSATRAPAKPTARKPAEKKPSAAKKPSIAKRTTAAKAEAKPKPAAKKPSTEKPTPRKPRTKKTEEK